MTAPRASGFAPGTRTPEPSLWPSRPGRGAINRSMVSVIPAFGQRQEYAQGSPGNINVLSAALERAASVFGSTPSSEIQLPRGQSPEIGECSAMLIATGDSIC